MDDRRQASAWEDWGLIDPLWSNLTDPGTDHGGWDLDAFWKLGEQEISGIMSAADRLGYPKQREEALDFGCGAGRLTRALTAYFDRCTGVDGAQSMVELASELNRGLPCRFVRARDSDLVSFPAKTMDLVYSSFVLQHLPDESFARRTIDGLARLVRPSGLLAFQLPTEVPSRSVRERLALRTRAYGALRGLGISPRVLFERMGLRPPMHMLAISVDGVSAQLATLGFDVLEVKIETLPGSIESAVYFASPAADA
jgi:SAM-dependent methyltransferase